MAEHFLPRTKVKTPEGDIVPDVATPEQSQKKRDVRFVLQPVWFLLAVAALVGVLLLPIDTLAWEGQVALAILAFATMSSTFNNS